MLALVLLGAWFVVLVFAFALCRMASLTDPERSSSRQPGASIPLGAPGWEDDPEAGKQVR